MLRTPGPLDSAWHTLLRSLIIFLPFPWVPYPTITVCSATLHALYPQRLSAHGGSKQDSYLSIVKVYRILPYAKAAGGELDCSECLESLM